MSTTTPSSSGDTQPPPVFFDCQNLDQLEKALPPALLDLAAGALRLGKEHLDGVIATGLAHLGAALGGSHQLEISPLRRVTAQFHLLVTAPEGVATHWPEWIGLPWLQGVEKFTPEPEDHTHPAGAWHQAEAREAQNQGRRGSPAPAPKARFLVRGLRPREIRRALPHAFDGVLTLANGGLDPVAEWLLLGKSEGLEFLRWIKDGWLGGPLAAMEDQPTREGMLQVLWTAQDTVVQKWLAQHRTLHPHEAIPLVLVPWGQDTAPLYQADYNPSGSWHPLLTEAFARRIHGRAPQRWRIAEQGLERLKEFHGDFKRRCAGLNDHYRDQLSWLADLALRLALLLGVEEEMRQATGSRNAHPTAGGSGSISVSQADRACEITLWLAQEHLMSLERLTGIASAPPTAGASPSQSCPGDGNDKGDTCDIETLGEAICVCLAASGPLEPRDILRKFHRLRACQRDAALKYLRQKGRIADVPGGKVGLRK